MPFENISQATVSTERVINAPPAQVYMAWSNPNVKARWFVGPRGQWKERIREFDFRVGGRERLVGVTLDGKMLTYESRYLDIVPEQRIIYQYEMSYDKSRVSISLATLLFAPEGAGTRLKYMEQALFLDGYDDAGRREKRASVLIDHREKRASVLIDQMENSLRVKPTR